MVNKVKLSLFMAYCYFIVISLCLYAVMDGIQYSCKTTQKAKHHHHTLLTTHAGKPKLTSLKKKSKTKQKPNQIKAFIFC